MAKKTASNRFSAEWSEKLFQQLGEGDTIDGCPTYLTLKRLVSENISPIVSIESEIEQFMGQERVVTATATLTLQNGEIYQASADAYSGNVTFGAARTHLTATADTRAKARACKEALCLKNLMSAEELTDTVDAEESIPCSIIQKRVIEQKANLLGIELPETVSHILGNKKMLDALNHNEATKVIKALDEWKRNKEVPTELKS